MPNRRSALSALAYVVGAGFATVSQSGCAMRGAQPVPASAGTSSRHAGRVVASSPTGSFYENLMFGPDRALYITDYTARQVLRYTSSAGLKVHAQLDAHPLGIQFAGDGTLVVSAQKQSLFGAGGTMFNGRTLYRARPGGALTYWQDLADASFLNGIARLDATSMLMADSRGGVLWRLDVDTGRTSVFVRDPLLDAADAKSATPAANGVKIFQGAVYVSNTARGLMLRIPLMGMVPGKVEVLAENVRADDFAFSPAGKLYYTTHRDSVFVLEGGKSTEFAGAESGLRGNTALAWAPNGAGPFVITDGGYVAQQWYGGGAATPAQLVQFF